MDQEAVPSRPDWLRRRRRNYGAAAARLAELSISIPNVKDSKERIERYLLSDDFVRKGFPGSLEAGRAAVYAAIAGMTEPEMERYLRTFKEALQTGKGMDTESRFAKTEDIAREQAELRPYMVGGGYEASGMYIDTPDTESAAEAAFRAESMRLRMVGGRRYDATGVFVQGNVNGGGDDYFRDDKYYTAEGEYVGGWAAIDENDSRNAKANKIGGFSPDPQVMQAGGAGSWAAMAALVMATIAMACVPR